MLQITRQLAISEEEITFSAIRAQGAGGQNVNKVSSAIHLRFDIHASSLPDSVKQRLLKLRDRRISSDGVVVIKAQRSRSQEKNREAAIGRLRELIMKACEAPKPRKATRPTKSSQRKRLEEKGRRGRIKQLRGRVDE
ncbi:MAG: alternative ribosome rescue aminoacyl-tRNA hydrolase ArfB [Sedimenticola sp.]|nr:alternative ribosome rescue aminoacyl-tRNA hydrolase ArfB [Sedimenticola sp.]